MIQMNAQTPTAPLSYPGWIISLSTALQLSAANFQAPQQLSSLEIQFACPALQLVDIRSYSVHTKISVKPTNSGVNQH